MYIWREVLAEVHKQETTFILYVWVVVMYNHVVEFHCALLFCVICQPVLSIQPFSISVKPMYDHKWTLNLFYDKLCFTPCNDAMVPQSVISSGSSSAGLEGQMRQWISVGVNMLMDKTSASLTTWCGMSTGINFLLRRYNTMFSSFCPVGGYWQWSNTGTYSSLSVSSSSASTSSFHQHYQQLRGEEMPAVLVSAVECTTLQELYANNLSLKENKHTSICHSWYQRWLLLFWSGTNSG